VASKVNNSVEDKVLELVASVMNVSVSSLNGQSSPSSVPGWESMKQINLILAVEESFDVQFDDEQITRLSDVASIIDAVESMVV
jgi:acyl carrier protein